VTIWERNFIKTLGLRPTDRQLDVLRSITRKLVS
jgi:hypothetical protein